MSDVHFVGVGRRRVNCNIGVIQVLRNARGGGWVYAQALRGGGGGVTPALRNVIFFANTAWFTVMSSRPTRISK